MQETIQISEIENKRYLLVRGSSFDSLPETIKRVREKAEAEFCDFQPNPTFENVANGIKAFNKSHCDAIIAVGGGSAIDVAKCIKYASMYDYFKEVIALKDISLTVIPTTAGTGSESTKFAVIYKDGVKQSIFDERILPDKVVFYPNVLKTLSLYQKKATLLDALCHAMESYWSMNSCEESRNYSIKAIKLILNNYEGYLNGNEETFEEMFLASNFAGKAINITTTTAGHAMAYKLTSLYGASHGHAVALVVEKLYPYLLHHIDDCVREECKECLLQLKDKISPEEFEALMVKMNLGKIKARNEDFEKLAASVNMQRLQNNPIALSFEEIDDLYHQILKG